MQKTKRVVLMVVAVVVVAWNCANGAAPVLGGVQAASDGGIVIRWSSEADKIYRIDHTSALTEPTQWHELYTDYPSHGTLTFWKDVGNPFAFPPAPHPQDGPMRIYRIVEIGANNSSKPTVSITAPSQGATVADTIAVDLSISSSLPVEHVRLFVDGGEAAILPYSAAHFMLNSCEFPNGERKLLAVVRNSGGGETTEEVATYVENVTASAFRSITFNNYISEFRVSKRLFEPAESQTVRFLAKFAAYSDWTLTIKNASDVVVRTVNGTDFRLNFLWDGRSDDGSIVPSGHYNATLSAATSVQQPPPPGGGGGGGTPPAPDGQSAIEATGGGGEAFYPSSAREAVMAGLPSCFVQPPPMPPINTNGVIVPWERVFGPLLPTEVKISDKLRESILASLDGANRATSGIETLDAGGGQTTTLGPVRVGFSGSFAIAYQGHHPQGTSFPASSFPDDGLFGTVSLNAGPGAFPKLRSLRNISSGLESVLGRVGYRLVNKLADDKVTLADLNGVPYGGRGTLNEANLGFYCGHGVYGLDPDFTISASGPRQTYTPLYQTGNNFYEWFRISNGDFGGSFRDANGNIHAGNMRWMCILTCNNLQSDAFDDMYNKEVLPITDDLHLLLGCSTTSHMVSNFGARFGHALTGVFTSPTPQRSIVESWFYAAVESQGLANPRDPVRFRVAGWPNNFSDFIDNYQEPDSGNPADITFDDRQVWP